MPSASAAPRAATSAPGGIGRGEPPGEVHLVHVAGRDRRRGSARRRPGTRPRTSELVHASGAGPRHGGPGHGRAGRTWAKRAQTGGPSKGSTTAQKPDGVEGGQVGGDVDQLGGQPAADHRQGTAAAVGAGTAAAYDHTPSPPSPVPAGRPVAPPCTSSSPTSRTRCARSSATSPRREIAPHAEAWDRDHTSPSTSCGAMGEPRAVRHPVPRGVRRRRRRPHDALHRHRGAGPRRPLDGHHPRGRRRPRRQPDLPVRHRGAEADAGCPTSAPAGPSAASASPSPRPGSDAGGTRTTARARRRRRGSGCSNGEKAFITNSGTDDHRRSSPSPPAPGPGEISTIIVPAGTPGLRGAAAVPEDGLARLRHPRAHVHATAGCPRPTCSASGAGASPSSSQILDEGRIAISALAVGVHPGLPRALHRSTRRTATPSASPSAPTRAWPSRWPTSR